MPAIACNNQAQPHANPPGPTDTVTANPPSPVTGNPSTTATTSASVAQAPVAPTASAFVHGDSVWTVTQSNGTCTAMMEAACDHCNPPPPSSYECPKSIAAASYPIEVTQRGNSQVCTAEYTQYSGGGNCPAGMHCNPPPPHKVTVSVPCPK